MNFEKYTTEELKSISEKLDILIDSTIRQDEQIKQAKHDIDDVKKNIIPEAVKNANTKVKYLIVSSVLSYAVGIIAFFITKYIL